ncbi:MAG: DUF6498-containing protein [Pseudorhodoplanes sp.]|jgi:hypothetical protein|nr:DUF6498-containing protein [Pseudorhodoplanes sp.]
MMHLTILIGGFFAVALGTTGALMFMVALKIAIDLRLHLKNDSRKSKAANGVTTAALVPAGTTKGQGIAKRDPE